MKNKLLHIFLLACVLLAYAIISVLAHYFFETNAYDLGIFNEALWNYSHLQLGPSTFRHVPVLLGDHFKLYLFVLSPLYYIFGSYTLLLVQIGLIFLTAFGIYKLLKVHTQSTFFSSVGSYGFLVFFATVIAVSFDYHNDVLGVAFIPWILYFWEKRNINKAVILALLMGFSKETFFLISSMIGLSILIFEKQKRDKVKGFILFIASILLFLFLLKGVIPFFGTGEYGHWSYSTLGSGPVEVIYFILTNPISAFSLFFSDPIKIESLKYLLLSGLIFSFFFPRYFLLFIPFFAQKYFSDNPAHWGLYFHYNILIAPLIAVTVPLFFHWMQGRFPYYKKLFFYILAFWLIGNIYITMKMNFIYVPEYVLKEDIMETRFKKHSALLNLLQNIDEKHIVAVQGNICPHLVGKVKKLYIADAKMIEEWSPDFILLDLETKALWPFNDQSEFLEEIKQIEKSGLYTTVQKNDSIVLYKKI